jgi:hypothetical protein
MDCEKKQNWSKQELIQYKLTDSVYNKEVLPQQWKESIIVHIYKKGDKIDCSNYGGLSLLPATCKIYPVFFS